MTELTDMIKIVAGARLTAKEMVDKKKALYDEFIAGHTDFFGDVVTAQTVVDEAEDKLRELTLKAYAETGDKPPNVVIRSHLHQFADTGMNFNSIRLIATPAWQLITGYVHRLQPGALADIGGLIFVCYPGGKYELEVVRYRPKRRKPIRVTDE